jgi:hypothetical protein
MRKMIVDSHPEAKVDEGIWRVDVYDYLFDVAVEQLEKIPVQSMGGVDPALWDVMRWDYFRWDVTVPLFDKAVVELEKK